MAYTVYKEFTFAAAHHIPDHPGKCRHLHGHNYKVRLYLSASQLDALGMVVDFAAVKAQLKEAAGQFDHRVINDLPPFDDINPTAELLAEYLFRRLEERLSNDRVTVCRLEVQENDSSGAIFEP